MREIWTNVLHTSAARIYSLAIGMLVLVATARLLGPEGRGQLAAASAWATLFATCAYLSLGQVALHRMTGDPERKRLGPLFGTLVAAAAVLSLAAWGFAGAMYFLTPDAFHGVPPLVLLAAFTAIPFLIWEHYGSYLLTGLNRVRIYNTYQVIGQTLSVLAVLLMILILGWGVPGAALGSAIGAAVMAVGGIRFVASSARASGSIKPSAEEFRALLSGGAKLHLNAIGTVILGYASVLALNHYRSSEEVGWFQLASQLVGMLMILPQAGTMILFGEVARLGPDAAWPANKRLLGQLLAASCALAGISALLAPWIVRLLAGPAFTPAVTAFQWMVGGLLGATCSAVMAPQWIGRGYFWQASAITLLVGCLNLAANLWLIPPYGMQGAVAVFLGTSVLQVVTNLGLAARCELRQRRAVLAYPAAAGS